MQATALFDRIYGGLLGMAVGDALGGPVEGLHYLQIHQQYGRVTEMLPYQKDPSEHAQFSNQPGSYTDDTRLALIYCAAILQANGSPVRGDLAKALADYHYSHNGELERSFIEEYYLKGLYGSRKLIYGGQPTNGAIMSIAPVGLLHPADPKAAFELAYELSFVTDGYAKESAAIAAAAIAEAMRPGVSVEQIVQVSLETATWFRREGTLWPKTVREREWARFEGQPNQELIGAALEAAQHHDVFTLPKLLYPKLLVSPVGSEAGQTLAVAFAMLVAAKGDFSLAVQGAVNYGRDCDSYAAVVGAITGAMQGSKAIPAEWGEAVLGANPNPDLRQVASDLCKVVTQQHLERQATVQAVEQLLS